jgi:hypothetical protein
LPHYYKPIQKAKEAHMREMTSEEIAITAGAVTTTTSETPPIVYMTPGQIARAGGPSPDPMPTPVPNFTDL